MSSSATASNNEGSPANDATTGGATPSASLPTPPDAPQERMESLASMDGYDDEAIDGYDDYALQGGGGGGGAGGKTEKRRTNRGGGSQNVYSSKHVRAQEAQRAAGTHHKK